MQGKRKERRRVSLPEELAHVRAFARAFKRVRTCGGLGVDTLLLKRVKQ